MRVLIDTMIVIWALRSPERLSRKAMAALQALETVREMSSISLSEIAIKQARGKLDLSKADVSLGITDLQLRILPYTASHAYYLFGLPSHHPEPFDRQIIAQVLPEAIPVETVAGTFHR